MYILKAGDATLHRSVDTMLKTDKCISGKLTQELNAADSLEFQMPPVSSGYRKIQNLLTQIQLTNDGDYLFLGRALEQNYDFYNRVTVKCKGFLDYLNDGVARPASVSGISAEQFLSDVITQYNAQVDEFKQLKIGNITVDADIELEYDYTSTYDVIFNKLIGAYGGYVKHRRSGGVNYIDYTAQSGVTIDSVVVRFGNNLLDIQKYLNADDVYTVLVPYGEDGITVESVNDSKNYIENNLGISTFGRICRSKKFDGITTASELLTAAQADLDQNITQSLTLELTAVEMKLINMDIRSTVVGNIYRAVSTPHGIDDYFCCSKKVTDFINPQNSKITFGVTRDTLTDLIKRKVL